MCLGKYLTQKISHPNAIVLFTVVPCIVWLCSRDCASSIIGATLFRAKRWNDYDRSDKKGLALPPPVRMLVLTLTSLKLLAHGHCLPFTPNQMVAILKYALVYGMRCTATVLPRILVSSGISLCVYCLLYTSDAADE